MDKQDKPLTPPQPPDKRIIKEDIPKRKLLRFLERGVYIITILAMAAVLMLGYADHKNWSKEIMLELKQTDTARNEAVSKAARLSERNSILENKLHDLKNKQDLERRDLESYIIKKYRTVPAIVAKEVADKVVKITKEQRVPFSLIVGLIEIESQFKPWAVSKKDARGLMQVMPFWIKKKKEIGMVLTSKYDLHDIETNIKAGIQVFKYHLKEANNDINQGLYLYVGKDRTYADKVFNAMGRFEIFRSTLDTTLRAEEGGQNSKDTQAVKVSAKKGA
jgi:hypothetical protein